MNHPDAGHTSRETGTTMHYTGIRGGTIAFFPGPAGIRVQVHRPDNPESRDVVEFWLNTGQVIDLFHVLADLLLARITESGPHDFGVSTHDATTLLQIAVDVLADGSRYGTPS